MCQYYDNESGGYVVCCDKTRRPGYHMSIKSLRKIPLECREEVKAQIKKQGENKDVTRDSYF